MDSAVVQTVGALRWAELNDTFGQLVRDTKVNMLDVHSLRRVYTFSAFIHNLFM